MPRRPDTPSWCRWRSGCWAVLVPFTRGVDPGDLPPGSAFHAGRGLCRTHHRYAKDRGQLDQYPRLTRQLSDVLGGWATRSSTGNDQDDIAKLAAELGMTYSGVRNALVRGGVELGAPRARRRAAPKPRPPRVTPPPKPPPPPKPLRPSLGWSRPGLFDSDTSDEGEG